ncbi:MAG: hypothetical protein M2R45_03506 [Verrucomicrobia subdivision 3 bacterium]|nr:hypothetical protein [Limisphaerales bacterium]MCS1415902.1 hypothetical protein [Limisphaerales bacterium]
MRICSHLHLRVLLLGLISLFFAGGTIVAGQSSKFLRFVKTGSGEGHVDTAIATYRMANGIEIALIGALHIADKEYFDTLNKRFRNYDVVLYEMIKDKRVRSDRMGRSTHFVSQMQMMMKNVLALEFQLEAVDYGQPNFVHADMDTKTFAKLQRQKGENFFTLMLQSLLQERRMQLSGQSKPLSPFELLSAFSSKDSAYSLKWLFAQQLDQIEMMISGIDQGMDGKGSVIVSERNKVAMAVLDQQLRQRKRKLAIFYGAGHMPDLEQRLLARGFRKVRHEWLTAWNLRP